MEVGKTYKSRMAGDFIITAISGKYASVTFIDTGYKTKSRRDSILTGRVKDKLHPAVHGVGFIGEGEYITSVSGGNVASYRCWQRMLGRCYDPNYIHSSAYFGCTVHDDWHNFQNFAEWYEKNYPNDGYSYHLDKDIKIEGNKEYSKDACIFVTAKENAEKALARDYKLVSPSGEIVCFYNMAKFCRDNNLDKGNISGLIKGKYKSSKGWVVCNE